MRNRRAFPRLSALLFWLAVLGVVAPPTWGSGLVPREQWISDDAARITLAWLLGQSPHQADLREAHALLQAVREREPRNPRALSAHVPVLLALGHRAEALQTAQALRTAFPEDPAHLLLLADVHAALGHYVETRDLYRKAAASAEPEFLLRRADRLNLWGDFVGAELQLLQLLEHSQNDPDLLLRLARVFYSQQRYAEALALLAEHRPLLEMEAESRRGARLLTLELHLARKDFLQGREAAALFLQEEPDFTAAILLQGELLLQEGRGAEAAALFRALAEAHEDLRAVALTGAARAELARDGWHDPARRGVAFTAAEQAQALAPQAPLPPLLLLLGRGVPPESIPDQAQGQDPETLVAWAASLVELCGPQGLEPATRLLELALTQDPGHFPARLALVRILAARNRHAPALEQLALLRRDFPESDTLLLTEARLLAWSKDYAAGLERYQALLRLSPLNPVPLREAARTAWWSKAPLLGDMLYAELESRELHDLELAVSLERRAKRSAWDLRFIRARRDLQALTTEEPGNQEALFDLAQAQCALGLCDEEAASYQRLLALDPTHTLAGYALERRRLRSAPAVGARFSLWDEEGYGALSQMTRGETLVRADLPLGARFRLELGSGGYLYAPRQQGETRHAVGQSLDVNGVVNEYLSISGGVLAKLFDGEPRDSWSGHAGLRLNLEDWVTLDLGWRYAEVYANSFALEQGVHAHRLRLNAETRPWRRLELQLGYEHFYFSDANDGYLLGGQAKVLLSDHPRTLALGLELQHRDTRRESVYHYAGAELQDIDYPYWTPQNYYSGGLNLQWRHDLSEFFFCGSRPHWYELQFGAGTDSDNNPYLRASAAWRWEFVERWTLDLEALVHHSEQWKGRQLGLGLTHRF